MKDNQLQIIKLKERRLKLTVLIEESRREIKLIDMNIKELWKQGVNPKSVRNLKPNYGKGSRNKGSKQA